MLDEQDRRDGFVLPCVHEGQERLHGRRLSRAHHGRDAHSRTAGRGGVISARPRRSATSSCSSALAAAAFAAFVLIGLDGWTYYTHAAAVRGYTKAHQLLRPAGRAGHLFGVGGFVLMLVPGGVLGPQEGAPASGTSAA